MARDPRSRRPGDGLVTAGGVLFLAGVVAIVVTVAPYVLGTTRLPTVFYLLCLLAPLGLATALLGLLRSALAQRLPRPPEDIDLHIEL